MLFDPAWSWPINVSLASSLRMNLAVTAFRTTLPSCFRLRLLSAAFSAPVFRLQRLPPCEVAAASRLSISGGIHEVSFVKTFQK